MSDNQISQPSTAREVAYRRRRAVASLTVWFRAVEIATVVALTLNIWFMLEPPWSTESQLAPMTKMIERFEGTAVGKTEGSAHSFKLVGLGTSLLKNVTFSPSIVQNAAKSGGLDQTVDALTIAINWGGFERINPIVDRIRDMRPDAVIIMPEFLAEDFSWRAKWTFAMQYSYQILRHRDFHLFDPKEEFSQPVCKGFELSAAARMRIHKRWISRASLRSKGPKLAYSAIEDLANTGILVIIARIPRHPDLERLMPRDSSELLAATRQLASKYENVIALMNPPVFDRDAFCDYAHLHPEKAQRWMSWVFQAIAARSAEPSHPDSPYRAQSAMSPDFAVR